MKKRIIFLMLLFITLIGTFSTASATDFYVATSGNNGNNGYVNNPFATIEHGAELLTAGDTLYIQSGTYNGEDVELRNSGTSTNPINIIGIGDVTMLSDNHGHAFNLLNVEYINFENIEIFHYSQGIYCVDISNIHINNCYIHFIGTSTISFKDADYCSITNCDLSDTGWNNIQIMSTNRDTHHIQINNNKIHGCPGVSDFDKSHNGIDLFNSDSNGIHQLRDMEIIGNKMYDMSGYNAAIFTHGYATKHMDRFVIADNEIYDTARTIISFMRDLEFRNNNMYNNHWDGFRTLYPEKLIGPAYIHGNTIKNSNYDTRMVCTGNGILFENEDYGLFHVEGGSPIFRNPARKTITIKDSGSGQIIFQLTDGRDFTHNGNGQKTTITDGYQLIVDGETVDITTTDYIQPDPTPNPTETPDPTPTDTPKIQYNNKIKASSPNTVYNYHEYIDIGKIDNIERRIFMLFNNLPEEEVETATLSLFWYYEYGGNEAEIEVFRPAEWNPTYLSWNCYDNGLLWSVPGGDYFESYDSIILFGTPDNQYYDFDVTNLVNSYINGTYENNGFMLKVTDEKDGYMAFYSIEHPDVNQIPKLTFTDIPEPTPTPEPTPEPNITPVLNYIGDKNITVGELLEFEVIGIDENNDNLTFSVLYSPPESLFINQIFSWTPQESDIGEHSMYFIVSDNSTYDYELVHITVNEIPVYPRWDVNEDGIVNMLDLDIVALHYGEITI